MNELTRRQLDAYLDGTLADSERISFERMIRMDPKLHEAVQQQRFIDQSLRRLIAISPNVTAASMLKQAQMPKANADLHTGSASQPRAAADSSQGRWSAKAWMKKLAIAAVLALGVVGVWSIWTFYVSPQPNFRHSSQTRLRLDQYYEGKVGAGFQPYWVCENDEQFTGIFRDRLGQALLLRPLPATITAGGLDYCTTFSNQSIAVLMRVEGTEVVVIVDQAGAVKSSDLPNRCQLKAFRRTIGDLTLVEVSPFDQPSVLDLFYNPDDPASSAESDGGAVSPREPTWRSDR